MQYRQLPLPEKNSMLHTQSNILEMLKSSFQNGLWSKEFFGFLVLECKIYCVTAILKPCYTTPPAFWFLLVSTYKAM